MISGRLRESDLPDTPPGYEDATAPGRKCISVIGIDRYRHWLRLDNAVSDAEGVVAAFGRLGFTPLVAPLYNDKATFDEMQRLPANLGRKLGWNDSLVVFFAGHGYTAKPPVPYGLPDPKGYLIPVDADPSDTRGDDHRERRWQPIDSWL